MNYDTTRASAIIAAGMTSVGGDIRTRLEQRMRAIATEIGKDLFDIKTIMDTFGVTPEEWDRLAVDHGFQQMIRDAREQWGTTSNLRERTELETMLAVRDSIPAIYAMVHDSKENGTARVAAFQALQKGAGIGGRDGTGVGEGPGKVSIVINMGENKQVRVAAELPPITLEGNLVDS